MRNAIKVLLVEDHAVVREGLRMLLERQPDLEVVAEAASVGEAVGSPSEPDVILADLILGDARGPAVVAGLHERFPRAAVLVLTMLANPDDVRGALAAGARGYLLKGVNADELVTAVREVAKGDEYLQPALGAALTRQRRRRDPLSRREREVLRLIAAGHTNAEIATLLGVGQRTVEAHRAHILQKLGLRTRAGLVHYAQTEGLTDKP